MLVCVNPDRLKADEAFKVHHPVTGRAFPSDPFDMSEADWTNPRIRRLFAPSGASGGADGGVFGDLLLVSAGQATTSAAAQAVVTQSDPTEEH